MREKIKEATDEEISALPTKYQCSVCGCKNPDACETFLPRLLVRIEADRARITELKRGGHDILAGRGED